MVTARILSGRRMLSRRELLATIGALALAAGAGLSAFPALAQQKGPSEVPVEELMKPGPLGELTLGPADAKVTVVEYASMTCSHCAHFAKDVWPDFKKKYIDTGKIHFVFREFPLDNLAAAASMLARCAGGDKTFPLIEVLFAKQADWAFVEGNPVPKLFEIAKQAGFTQEFVRQVPDRPEAPRQHHRRPEARLRSVRRQRDADILRQRQASGGRADDRSVRQDDRAAAGQELS